MARACDFHHLPSYHVTRCAHHGLRRISLIGLVVAHAVARVVLNVRDELLRKRPLVRDDKTCAAAASTGIVASCSAACVRTRAAGGDVWRAPVRQHLPRAQRRNVKFSPHRQAVLPKAIRRPLQLRKRDAHGLHGSDQGRV
jgi:hypothetical protein